MNRGAFLDVDGVIRENDRSKLGGPYYTLHKDQVEFIDGAMESMKMLDSAGYKIYWITMQNCIVEKKATFLQIKDIFDFMIKAVYDSIGIVVDYKICTVEDNGLKVIAKRDAVLRFAVSDNINLRDSFGAGDAMSDIQAFRMAGIGHLAHIDIPRGDHNVIEADVTFPKLLEAVIDLTQSPIIGADILSAHVLTVKKVWGFEDWLINSKGGNYCSKILMLKVGHKSSLHYHIKKHETFLVLSGIVYIKHGGLLSKCIAGDKVDIVPKEPHSFEALYGNAYILEVSTYHEDADCVRLEMSR